MASQIVSRHNFYYILDNGAGLTLHLSRAEAADLYSKIGAAIYHKNGHARGRRVLCVNFFRKARVFTKLHIVTHDAHKRQCAEKADAAHKWVTA